MPWLVEPTGATNYYAHRKQYWDDFRSGRQPIFAKGVRFEYVENDGSREWRELQARAREGSVHSKERIL